jgi:hypothetical protein
VASADIKVAASCRKAVVSTGLTGSGDWVCTLVWSGPNRQTLRDTYEVYVGTNGCYTATTNGAETNLGGPILSAPDGTLVRNLLYTFDGCFDTT